MTAVTSDANVLRDDVSKARPRFQAHRWVIGAILLIVAAQLAWFLITNDRFQWDVVGKYLFDPTVLKGLGTTVLLAVLAMVIGSVVGGGLAAAPVRGVAPVRGG